MARARLHEVIQVLQSRREWQAQGGDDPEDVLQMVLHDASIDRRSEVLDESLVRRSINYEGRNTTVVLDFDDLGYSRAIEFT